MGGRDLHPFPPPQSCPECLRSGMESSRVGVQHSCTNSLSPWLSSSLAQRSRREAEGGKSKGRTASKCRERKTKQKFLLYELIANQVSLFLSLKLSGTGIMWVLSNNFLSNRFKIAKDFVVCHDEQFSRPVN